MSTDFASALAERGWLLADGATGTNYFAMGLQSGDPPEDWNKIHPEKVRDLHRAFIEAGSDIVLSNTFGANRRRLMLHNQQEQARELNVLAAQHARAEADAAKRQVFVAGSMGPTGDIMQPVGELSREEAVEVFTEQAEGLAEGGADLLWIETLSSEEEASAAVEGAASTGLPVFATLSFDTNGRTMMGISPKDWPGMAARLPNPVAGLGANCGVGASELVATVMSIVEAAPDGAVVIAKGNCGVPEFIDGEIRYSGTPELMAEYARLAVDAGARIIGGCCGTTPVHVASMRAALDGHTRRPAPDVEAVIAALGDVSDLAKGVDAAAAAGPRRRRRRS